MTTNGRQLSAVTALEVTGLQALRFRNRTIISKNEQCLVFGLSEVMENGRSGPLDFPSDPSDGGARPACSLSRQRLVQRSHADGENLAGCLSDVETESATDGGVINID